MVEDTVATENGEVALRKWGEHAAPMLMNWRQRTAAASEAHYKLATGLRRKNLALGVPVVIFSSVVGTSLFTTLADPEAVISPMFKIATGSISIVAAILAALQNFLRFGERAERHVVAADWYAAVRRDIEQTLALSPEQRGKPEERFNHIRKEMSKIGQQSPEIGDRMWEVMAKKYGVDTLLPLGGPP